MSSRDNEFPLKTWQNLSEVLNSPNRFSTMDSICKVHTYTKLDPLPMQNQSQHPPSNGWPVWWWQVNVLPLIFRTLHPYTFLALKYAGPFDRIGQERHSGVSMVWVQWEKDHYIITSTQSCFTPPVALMREKTIKNDSAMIVLWLTWRTKTRQEPELGKGTSWLQLPEYLKQYGLWPWVY